VLWKWRQAHPGGDGGIRSWDFKELIPGSIEMLHEALGQALMLKGVKQTIWISSRYGRWETGPYWGVNPPKKTKEIVKKRIEEEPVM
jgi:hypothetical protein